MGVGGCAASEIITLPGARWMHLPAGAKSRRRPLPHSIAARDCRTRAACQATRRQPGSEVPARQALFGVEGAAADEGVEGLAPIALLREEDCKEMVAHIGRELRTVEGEILVDLLVGDEDVASGAVIEEHLHGKLLLDLLDKFIVGHVLAVEHVAETVLVRTSLRLNQAVDPALDDVHRNLAPQGLEVKPDQLGDNHFVEDIGTNLGDGLHALAGIHLRRKLGFKLGGLDADVVGGDHCVRAHPCEDGLGDFRCKQSCRGGERQCCGDEFFV